MNNEQTILFTFAKNDLRLVSKEFNEIKELLNRIDYVNKVIIENTTIDDLSNAIFEVHDKLVLYHFGGHSDENNIVLEGFKYLDKIRLSRLLIPKENHNLQIVFLNGCLSYGHVGLLMAKGVKVVIATNVNVDDLEAVRLANLFYRHFFDRGSTLKESFESAEATVSGKNSFIISVNPGEIDENQYMPPSWTLFVNSKFSECINWNFQNFLKKKI